MQQPSPLSKRHRSPEELIRHAVWLSFRLLRRRNDPARRQPRLPCAAAPARRTANPGLSLALLFAGSACIMVFSSLNQTFLQTLAPAHLRGRVLSVMTVTTFGLLPLGGLAAGAAAQRWGASLVVAAGGAACALFALGVLVACPRLRRLT